MKVFFFIIILFAAVLKEEVLAQISPSNINPPPANKPFNFDQNLPLSSQDGQPFRGDVYDAEGTPYYYNDFRLAIITLANGRSYDSSSVRLDLVNHELQYITKEDKPIVLKEGLVKEIFFPNNYNQASVNEKFRTGYPPIDNNKTTSFYQVLSDGKLQLLKIIKKDFRQSKDPMSGEIKKEFVQNEFYYIYSTADFGRLKKDKDKVLELMQDKEKQMNSWLETNKINFRNIDDLASLFGYYNTLYK